MPNLFLVGGAVRDILMNNVSKDLDFVVETTSYDEARDYIVSIGCKIVQERPEYQVFRAVHPKLGGLDFALPRGDFNQDGRQSDTVVVSSIEEDLARRDFTMNAIAVGVDIHNDDVIIYSNKWIDPFNGKKDVREKIIRFVKDPAERIKEDNLRVLRALRFAITKGFDFDGITFYAIKNTVISDKVSPERIFEELNRMFFVSNTGTIRILNDTNQLYLLDRIRLRAST